jgi:hypothetical protein
MTTAEMVQILQGMMQPKTCDWCGALLTPDVPHDIRPRKHRYTQPGWAL